jgi:hypothetical protein
VSAALRVVSELVAAVAAVALATTPLSSRAAISLSSYDTGTEVHSTDLRSQAYDLGGCCASSLEIATPTGLPFELVQQAGTSPISSTTVYDFTTSVLAINMTDVCAPKGTSASYGSIYFTVDRDSTYAIQGTYTLGFTSGQLSAELRDLTVGAAGGDYVLLNEGLSSFTAYTSLTLGDPGNPRVGSVTGTLTAGHIYLRFVAVPEPSQLTAAVALALSLVLGVRQHRSPG